MVSIPKPFRLQFKTAAGSSFVLFGRLLVLTAILPFQKKMTQGFP